MAITAWSAKGVKLDKFVHSVFRITLSVWNVNYLALKHGSSGQRSPIDRNGMLLEVLFELVGATVISCEITSRAIASEEQCVIRPTQSRRRFDQSIEHRLQIEDRVADHLEHVGGGGLLLQRFPQLV